MSGLRWAASNKLNSGGTILGFAFQRGSRICNIWLTSLSSVYRVIPGASMHYGFSLFQRRESAERTTSVAGSHVKQSAVSAEASTSPNLATPRQVKVHKGPSGFGITLTDGTTNDNLRGIFITHISPDSPTAQVRN